MGGAGAGAVTVVAGAVTVVAGAVTVVAGAGAVVAGAGAGAGAAQATKLAIISTAKGINNNFFFTFASL